MAQATTRTPPTTLTYDEWKAEGERRFGPNMLTWRFVCPGCKNEQSAEDFRPFKDAGATTNSAYGQCLGRFLPKAQSRSWLHDTPRPGVRCDYASFGLFNICTTFVQPPDGPLTPIAVFEFGAALEQQPAADAVDPHADDSGPGSTRAPESSPSPDPRD